MSKDKDKSKDNKPVRPRYSSAVTRFPENDNERVQLMTAPYKWLRRFRNKNNPIYDLISALQEQYEWDDCDVVAYMVLMLDEFHAMPDAEKMAKGIATLNDPESAGALKDMLEKLTFKGFPHIFVTPGKDNTESNNCPEHKNLVPAGTACPACIQSVVDARPEDMSETDAAKKIHMIVDKMIASDAPHGALFGMEDNEEPVSH